MYESFLVKYLTMIRNCKYAYHLILINLTRDIKTIDSRWLYRLCHKFNYFIFEIFSMMVFHFIETAVFSLTYLENNFLIVKVVNEIRVQLKANLLNFRINTVWSWIHVKCLLQSRLHTTKMMIYCWECFVLDLSIFYFDIF